MLISPHAIARDLAKHHCVFEDASGELHGIGHIRLEDWEGEAAFVFVSDEVKIRENEEVDNTD